MKHAICNGGCKKGDCNGDCKRTSVIKKSGERTILASKDHERDKNDFNLHFDLLGAALKKARKERHLTKKELGRLVGVKESQISKIEKRLDVARLDTIIKVIKALHVKVNFSIELPDQTVTLR